MGSQELEILDDDESSCFCHDCQTAWVERYNYTKHDQIAGV